MKESKKILQNILSTAIDKRLLLEELKLSNLPNAIYGKGDYANTLYNFLKNNNIEIDVILIDEKYLNDSSVYWNEVPVKSVENLDLQTSERYNLIIGFSDFVTALKNLEKFNNVEKTFFFDSISFFDFFEKQILQEKWDEFYSTYLMLEDNKSREIMESFIKGKLSSFPNELYSLVEKNQYFPNDLISLTNNEIFVDVGAYNGDTILEFLKWSEGNYSKIYALEPDEKNFKDLLFTIEENKLENIEVFNTGSWSRKTKLKFNSDPLSTVKSKFSDDGFLSIDVDSIDNITSRSEVTYIKMDVEGSELESLKGASETISKWKPKLAIAMYHKYDDLITIPQFILGLRPDYKFYLRQHMYITQELILYAI